MNGHDFDAELRRAQAAVLEQETRAQNAERALELLRDEVATLRALQAEHTGCVTLVELRELLAQCEDRYALGGGRDATPEVLDAIAFFVVERSGETGGE